MCEAIKTSKFFDQIGLLSFRLRRIPQMKKLYEQRCLHGGKRMSDNIEMVKLMKYHETI